MIKITLLDFDNKPTHYVHSSHGEERDYILPDQFMFPCVSVDMSAVDGVMIEFDDLVVWRPLVEEERVVTFDGKFFISRDGDWQFGRPGENDLSVECLAACKAVADAANKAIAASYE